MDDDYGTRFSSVVPISLLSPTSRLSGARPAAGLAYERSRLAVFSLSLWLIIVYSSRMDKLYTTDDAAKYLGVTASRLRQFIIENGGQIIGGPHKQVDEGYPVKSCG